MSRDYTLPVAAKDPISESFTFPQLHLGFNTGPLIARLIHTWRLKDDSSCHMDPLLCTLWLDKEENLLEGISLAEEAGKITKNFQVNQIYHMRDVILIAARDKERSAPGPYRLCLTPSQKYSHIASSRQRPQFPLNGFQDTCEETLRNFGPYPSQLAGRITSMTIPQPNNIGSSSFTMKLQSSSLIKMTVHYNSDNCDSYLTHAYCTELTQPVICTVTALMVQPNAERYELLLTTTPASRLIFPTYNHQYREIMNRFFQEHRPIKVLSASNLEFPGLFRSPLPPPATLQQLQRNMLSEFPKYREPNWCLLKIDNFCPPQCRVIQHSPTYASYNMFVTCEDDTAILPFVFEDAPLTALFQLPTTEYQSLSNDQQGNIHIKIMKKHFTAEIYLPYPDLGFGSNLRVRALWDPLVFRQCMPPHD